MDTWFATAAFGLEGLVKRELLDMGIEAKAENGGARFQASPEDAFKANLFLRTADRVLLILKEEKVVTFEELFQLVSSIPWEDYLPRNARFPVSGNCARSQLMSISDCQSITKKAIVERLKKRYKTQWFEENGPEYAIQITLHNDIARVALNTSGDALNRRGYRTWTGEAPLRETLAAAMVLLSPWRKDTPVYDPCCGTGTLLIEAALIQSRRAPGLQRKFAMENWQMMSRKQSEFIRGEAQALYDPSLIQDISGSDKDPEALSLCRKHLRQAGLQSHIHVEEKDLRDVKLPQKDIQFFANPPYGERLGDRKIAEKIYRDLGELVSRHPGSRMGVLTAHHGFERFYGKKAQRKRRLYNGRLECEYLVY